MHFLANSCPDRSTRSHQRRSPWRASVLLVATLFVATLFLATSVSAATLALHAGDGEHAVKAARSDDGWRVQNASGKRLELPLSERARLEKLIVDDQGWLLTAVETSEDGERPIVVRGDAFGSQSLGTPPNAGGKVVLQPNALADDNGLRAMIWLEGDSFESLDVRMAHWHDDSWHSPETVAAGGNGTQIALTATVLDDGSWVAAWAGFDGVDDEIMVSHFVDSQWTAPQAITANRVPDVTPALRSTPDGALLAWSAYDGNDYRLYTARFDGKSWNQQATFGGRGSVFPTFADTEAPMVIFKQAVPRAWVVAELDAQGTPLRSAELAAAALDRPAVSAVSSDGLLLEWTADEFRSSSLQVPWQPNAASSPE